MRKCRFTKRELPPVKESNFYQKAGFFDLEAMAAYGIKKAREQEARKKARQASQERKESREAKQNLKARDYSYQFGLTKRAAQKLGNMLDKVAGFGCISCGTQKPSIVYCGGHYKTAGAHSEIALDIRNIHRQCNRYCNSGLSGNISGNKNTKGYTVGLVERYGREYVEWLDSYHPSPNYTCDDLKELRAVFAEECRRLERGEAPSRNWRELIPTKPPLN